MNLFFWKRQAASNEEGRPDGDLLVNIVSTIDKLQTQVNRIERKVYRSKEETEAENKEPVAPARFPNKYLDGG